MRSPAMLHATCVAVVGLLLVSTASATINTWFCNSAICGAGSCSVSANITEGACSRSQAGTPSFIKAQCIANPTAEALCAQFYVFGTVEALPDPNVCSLATAVTQTFPCNVCLAQGPDGMSMQFTGCNAAGQGFNFSSHCNSDCSSCADTVFVGPQDTCTVVSGHRVRWMNPYACPKLISYVEYNDESCSSTNDNSVRYFIPGAQFCNGYSGHSNAAANVFTCV